MQKLFLLVALLFASSFAQNNCDYSEIEQCSDSYSTCASSATTTDEICSCLITYGGCASCAGDCFSQEQIDQLVESCEAVGCSGCENFWSCDGTCNTTQLLDCTDTYSTCVSTASTPAQICDCYLNFGDCGACAGDCYTEAQIQKSIDACQAAGCAGCDDFWSCGAICNATQLSDCVNTYTTCVADAYSPDAMCQCFAEYGGCGACTGDCYTQTQINDLINACYTAGCSDCWDIWTCGGASCDSSVLSTCADTYSTCIADSSSTKDICDCYINYGGCASCAGDCYTSDQITSLIDSCNQAGCSGCDEFWECGHTSCNYTQLDQCGDAYSTCVYANSSDICNCYLAYGSCGACAGICYSDDQIASMEDSCNSLGCSGCDDFWSCQSKCNYTMLSECSDSYSTCVSNVTTTEEICDCYITYGNCIACAGECFTDAEKESSIEACESASCDTEECENFWTCSNDLSKRSLEF